MKFPQHTVPFGINEHEPIKIILTCAPVMHLANVFGLSPSEEGWPRNSSSFSKSLYSHDKDFPSVDVLYLLTASRCNYRNPTPPPPPIPYYS